MITSNVQFGCLKHFTVLLLFIDLGEYILWTNFKIDSNHSFSQKITNNKFTFLYEKLLIWLILNHIVWEASFYVRKKSSHLGIYPDGWNLARFVFIGSWDFIVELNRLKRTENIMRHDSTKYPEFVSGGATWINT